MSEPYDLDPQIDVLAKERVEAGFPVNDRYFVRLPLPPAATLREGQEILDVPATTCAWTGNDGVREEATWQVTTVEVTHFVRYRAEAFR